MSVKNKNPFISSSSRIPVKKFYGYRRSNDDTETVKVVKYTDLGAKSNVYVDNLALLLTNPELTAGDRIVILHVAAHVVRDSDKIDFDYKVLMELYDLKRTTAISAISHMCELGLLAKYGNGKYWINPYYIFRGSRPRLFLKYGEESEVLNVKDDGEI